MPLFENNDAISNLSADHSGIDSHTSSASTAVRKAELLERRHPPVDTQSITQPYAALPIVIDSIALARGSSHPGYVPRSLIYGTLMPVLWMISYVLLLGCCFLFLLHIVISGTQGIGTSVYSFGYSILNPLLSTTTGIVCTGTGYLCSINEPVVAPAVPSTPDVLPLIRELDVGVHDFGGLMDNVLQIADGNCLDIVLSRHHEFLRFARHVKYHTTLQNRQEVGAAAYDIALDLEEFEKRLSDINYHGMSFLGFFLEEFDILEERLSTVLINGSSQSWLELNQRLDGFLSQFADRLKGHENLSGLAIDLAENISSSLHTFGELLGAQAEGIIVAKKSKSAFYRTFILPLTLEGEELEFNMHTLVSASSFSDSAEVELKKIRVMVRNMWHSVVEMQTRTFAARAETISANKAMEIFKTSLLSLQDKREEYTKRFRRVPSL